MVERFYCLILTNAVVIEKLLCWALSNMSQLRFIALRTRIHGAEMLEALKVAKFVEDESLCFPLKLRISGEEKKCVIYRRTDDHRIPRILVPVMPPPSKIRALIIIGIFFSFSNFILYRFS